MKTTIKSKLLFIFLLAISCTMLACDLLEDEPSNNEFTEQTQAYGVYSGANVILEMKTNETQIIYDNNSTFFAIQNNDQTKFVKITLPENAEYLAVGDTFSSIIDTKGIPELIQSGTIKMEITKTEVNKIWLWSTEQSLGIVVKVI